MVRARAVKKSRSQSFWEQFSDVVTSEEVQRTNHGLVLLAVIMGGYVEPRHYAEIRAKYDRLFKFEESEKCRQKQTNH